MTTTRMEAEEDYVYNYIESFFPDAHDVPNYPNIYRLLRANALDELNAPIEEGNHGEPANV